MLAYEFVCVSNVYVFILCVGILSDFLCKFVLEISRMLNLILVYAKYLSSVFHVNGCQNFCLFELCVGILSDFLSKFVLEISKTLNLILTYDVFSIRFYQFAATLYSRISLYFKPTFHLPYYIEYKIPTVFYLNRWFNTQTGRSKLNQFVRINLSL